MAVEKRGATFPADAFPAPAELNEHVASDTPLPMRCVCGWCGTEIRSGGEPVTTGICPRCADAIRSEWISQR
jgi:hypothetical protein